MAPKESQKRASLKWDKENMITLGCKVKREQATAFKSYCVEQGKKSNAVLKEYVFTCIGEQDGSETPPTQPQDATGELLMAEGISLPPDALKIAQAAAEATGEALEGFVARAVETQAKRDKASLRMGINLATGDKLEKEA